MTVLAVVPKAAVGRRGHYGAWRALTAVPAMFGSLCLLLVLFGFLGQWEPVAMLAWLASGAAVFTRRGEQVTVRLGQGFRSPSRRQLTVLAPVWAKALAAAGYTAADVDLYVQRSTAVNAYAAGGRSVAVTTGGLAEFMAHHLGHEEMTAVLVHELGHHGTRGTRFDLVTQWLALPWRVVSRFVLGVCFALSGARHQPRVLLALVTVLVVTVAIVQAVQQGQYAVVTVLGGLAVCAVVCPLADAAIARRAEFAADRFAAEHGVGPQLAAAMERLEGDGADQMRWTARLLSCHPSVDRRIDALTDLAY
jgi:STE24 endopeptidase